ncbi:MAG TPA: helix-turn-helix transcriptional regulator [Magnetospirillaceae bacterium]
MTDVLNVAAVAGLIADPARTTMLTALIGGQALPAGELAYASGVSAPTASSHLAKLLDGGLITVEIEGRHRYYRLAGAHIAEVLEKLAAIAPNGPVRRMAMNPKLRELRFARRCYDHLAGQLGVAVTHCLHDRDLITRAPEKRLEVTDKGHDWFGKLGVDVDALTPTRRGIARQCLDCTERVHHMAGPLGVEFLSVLCTHGWMRLAKDSRAVIVTPKGDLELRRLLGIDTQKLRAQASA